MSRSTGLCLRSLFSVWIEKIFFLRFFFYLSSMSIVVVCLLQSIHAHQVKGRKRYTNVHMLFIDWLFIQWQSHFLVRRTACVPTSMLHSYRGHLSAGSEKFTETAFRLVFIRKITAHFPVRMSLLFGMPTVNKIWKKTRIHHRIIEELPIRHGHSLFVLIILFYASFRIRIRFEFEVLAALIKNIKCVPVLPPRWSHRDRNHCWSQSYGTRWTQAHGQHLFRARREPSF